ncbi:phosphoinositide phosphatase SAC2-like isoform X2 [Arachis stenosperma]|uniref:phosphoinositide phosphatase SAC2-like isoform X2 n=1 Tax=Arachis stenosperma TaxID=217475 RepID=UPI0025ABF9B4|nr:phosphoinositide phosphatase SAC2-like isoform X2 [Arachis stenosperma]
MAQRLLVALAAISITVAASFGDSVDFFDGGGKSEPQPTLYDELILPAGYPYAEYMIFSAKRGQWKAATQSWEYIRSFQRYYSNTYLDGNKQKAINLFLGHFQPQQGKPALWELDSDQYCTVGKHDPSSVDSNVRLTIRRSLSDGSILCKTDTTIRSMEHINCQHSGKSDQHCLLEVSPDIRICGSDVCHCRLISFCPQNSNLSIVINFDFPKNSETYLHRD